MNCFKSLVILFAIVLVSACGSNDRSASAASTTTTTTTTIPAPVSPWEVDSPETGSLLFKASVKDGPESAKIILKSTEATFVNAMMGTLDPDYRNELKLTTFIRIFNLDYFGDTIAEVDCPVNGIVVNFGPVTYSTLPSTIDLSVKGQTNTVKFSCKGSDGVRSFYVIIFKDATKNIDDGFELKFDFEQRNFIGRIYIIDKADDPTKVWGKTLLF
jgi:hypothetical protein